MMRRMVRKFARKSPMLTAEAYLDRAAEWAGFLVRATGLPVKADPYSAVARTVKQRTGASVPASKIYSLCRRRSSLKEIGAHIHDALRAAYTAECERQRKLLEHEIAIAKATGTSQVLVDEAEALVRSSHEAAQ